MNWPARLAFLTLLLLQVGCSDSVGPSDSAGAGLQLSIVGPDAVSDAEIDALGSAFDRVDTYTVSIVDATTLEAYVDTTIVIAMGGVVHDLGVVAPEAAFGRTVTITLVAFADGIELYRSVETTTLSVDAAGALDIEVEIRYTGPGIRGALRDAQDAPLSGAVVALLQGESVLEVVVTEDDGTYLFLDVAPGSYEVRPLPDQGSEFCPAGRDVSIAAVDDALLANFVSALSCTTDILIVSGGDFDDTDEVATVLTQDLSLNVSTFFFVNQLPSQALLTQYDVVVLFMNGLFDESAMLGNEIRTYIANGGNLVTASFYYQGRSDSGIGSVGWGALEQIDPLFPVVDVTTGVGGATYRTVTLDANSVVSHAMTEGLTTLASTSFSSGVGARADATVLARWDDGAPLVAYRTEAAGQRLVGVSLFPAPDATITGDVDLLWLNVVRWASYAPD